MNSQVTPSIEVGALDETSHDTLNITKHAIKNCIEVGALTEVSQDTVYVAKYTVLATKSTEKLAKDCVQVLNCVQDLYPTALVRYSQQNRVQHKYEMEKGKYLLYKMRLLLLGGDI